MSRFPKGTRFRYSLQPGEHLQTPSHVDPIARAWSQCNPAVPFPVQLRRDQLGILSRGMVKGD
jgi:hypothetical protein